MKINFRKVAIDYLGLIVALIVLIVVFSFLTRYFFSETTFLTIANQIPSAVLIATGITYILIIAEIDLSVGSVLGFCGAVLGVGLVNFKLPPFVAICLAIVAGLLCGFLNGIVSLKWRLPSFIVTLGMLEMARGGAHALTGSQTQYLGDKLDFVAGTSVFGLSVPFIVALAIVGLSQFVLSKTVFGRYIIAIGTNEEAVRLSGINPKPIKLAVFMLSGFLVSLAAIIDTSRFNSANPNAGIGFELQAIAAAVIGGTSLMGGRGSVISTFLGVLIIAVLNSGLAALGLRDEIKRLITGAVIITAVIVDYYRIRIKVNQK
ncbi:MAG: ABC transporter permease [Verrucomicrobiia bacterium]